MTDHTHTPALSEELIALPAFSGGGGTLGLRDSSRISRKYSEGASEHDRSHGRDEDGLKLHR